MNEHKVTKKISDQTRRNWCFTFFDYTDENIDHLQRIDESICKYIIYGHELTKEGKKHLQGYIEFHSNKRLTGVKKILDPILKSKSPIHLEPAIMNREQQKIYCSKGLQSKEEYNEHKEKGPNYGLNANIYEKTFKEFNEGKGKRNDWHKLYDRIKEEPDYTKILEEFPEYTIKYTHGIQTAISATINENRKTALYDEISDLILYNWETKLLEEIKKKPHNRKIIWYVDEKGGCGKSTFAKYLLSTHETAYFTNAKSADIAHAYSGEKTIVFDFTRSIEGCVNYGIIEALKNGIVFSSKYNSTTKVHATPHIICFSNFYPDTSKLSEDRWDIRKISINDPNDMGIDPSLHTSVVTLDHFGQATDETTETLPNRVDSPRAVRRPSLPPSRPQIDIDEQQDVDSVDMENIEFEPIPDDIKQYLDSLDAIPHPTDVGSPHADPQSVKPWGHSGVDDPKERHSECLPGDPPRPNADGIFNIIAVQIPCTDCNRYYELNIDKKNSDISNIFKFEDCSDHFLEFPIYESEFEIPYNEYRDYIDEN